MTCSITFSSRGWSVTIDGTFKLILLSGILKSNNDSSVILTSVLFAILRLNSPVCTAWKLSEYGVFLVRIQENADQKKLRIWTLDTFHAVFSSDKAIDKVNSCSQCIINSDMTCYSKYNSKLDDYLVILLTLNYSQK